MRGSVLSYSRVTVILPAFNLWLRIVNVLSRPSCILISWIGAWSMYEYVFIALTNSEIRTVLCSISFNKTSDESLASNHDNTFGRESEGKLFLILSKCTVSNPAATRVWASFQLSATLCVSSQDMICSSLSLSVSGSRCEEDFEVYSLIRLHSKSAIYARCSGVIFSL